MGLEGENPDIVLSESLNPCKEHQTSQNMLIIEYPLNQLSTKDKRLTIDINSPRYSLHKLLVAVRWNLEECLSICSTSQCKLKLDKTELTVLKYSAWVQEQKQTMYNCAELRFEGILDAGWLNLVNILKAESS